jgi:hypothetical protein
MLSAAFVLALLPAFAQEAPSPTGAPSSPAPIERVDPQQALLVDVNNTCGAGLACRIRITCQRTYSILGRRR